MEMSSNDWRPLEATAMDHGMVGIPDSSEIEIVKNEVDLSSDDFATEIPSGEYKNMYSNRIRIWCSENN